MAGIGFKLRKISDQDSLAGFLRGYFSAGLICCGPWILTVLTLSASDYLMQHSIGASTPNLFRLLLVYAYAFSLITTGALQTVVTRYLADRLYAEDASRHVPTYLALCLLNSPPQALFALLFVARMPMAAAFKVAGVALFVLVGNLWLLTIFLGAIRAYTTIIWAYILGAVVSVLAMSAMTGWGEIGYLLGYLLGQSVTYLWMLRLMLREFPAHDALDFGFLAYFRRYPALGVAGFLLNLGVWVGVFVYWASPYATWYYGLPTYYPRHDVAVFLALLTIIPALVLFFVRTETDFYEQYRAFFGGITSAKVRYSELQRRKSEMAQTLRQGLGDIVKVQGLVTVIVALYPEQVFATLQLPPETYAMIRNCAIGSFLLVLYQCTSTLLLYYEAYFEVALSALVLTVGNLLGALLTLRLGVWSHGIGLAIGAGAALLVALGWLHWVLRNLERITFMRQPMPGQIRLEVAESGDAVSQVLMRDGTWIGEPLP